MIKVIVGRLLQLIPVLVVILTLTFFMSKMVPGGPFSAERQATPEVIAKLNAYYGLDKPLWEQYLGYLSRVARLDFGPSYTYQSESVTEVIARAFPISLQIGTLAFCIALVIGVTAGVIAAVEQEQAVGLFPDVVINAWDLSADICVGTDSRARIWLGSEARTGEWLVRIKLCAFPSHDSAGSNARAVLCRLYRPVNSRWDAGHPKPGFYQDCSRKGSSGPRDHS